MEPITDQSFIDNHSELVQRLLNLVFPPIFGASEAICAFTPFSKKAFFASPAFKQLFLDDHNEVKASLEVYAKNLTRARRITGYLFILAEFYGIKKELDVPIVAKIIDEKNGLYRYFMLHTDFSFVGVKAKKTPVPLSDEKRAMILKNLDSPEKLKELIPPDNFEFHGFTVIRAIDVTVSEIISALERDLIDQQTLVSKKGFASVEARLASLFQCPDLKAAVSAIQADQVLLLNSGFEIDCNCIFAATRHVPAAELDETYWEKCVSWKKKLLMPDIQKLSPLKTDNLLFPGNTRSLIIVPLIFEDTCIGTFAICSPKPEAFSPLDTMRTTQLQPLFAIAIKKALNDLDLQVQGIIKEKCTAIHPSVEWRFQKAGVNYLNRVQDGESPEFEAIIFKDVVSLFAISDIRGSSKARNHAIRKDLLKQLDLAFAVINCAAHQGSLLILKEMAGRIDTEIKRLKQGLLTGDEVRIIHFLRNEVEPLFPDLTHFGNDVAAAVNCYESSLNKEILTVYEKRREFEDSVTLLNDRLASFVEKEEAQLQSDYPHYFEKHRTDGIDYQIYLGQALMETGTYSDLYLKNFRLWQIRLAAELARLTHNLQSTLKTRLDIAQLILVQNAPVSIKFRYDEKRFDVDGTYDTRQEIIKSRIDKAVIRDSKERLTQPGKIAVVFSQTSEALEIRRHLEFLNIEGYLAQEVEELELAGLPDIHGLKALRVRVILS